MFYSMCGDLDDYGRPVKNTRFNAPYSYDAFVLWDDGTGDGDPRKKVKNRDGAHSDRMAEWDYEKYNETVKVVSRHFSSVDPKEIEQFLRLYFDKPNLRLVRILEGYNVSNGYPYWYFRWIEEADAKNS